MGHQNISATMIYAKIKTDTLKKAGSAFDLSRVFTKFPHLGGALGSGKLEGKLVTCPAHQWQFDITTGECVTMDRCDDGCYVDTYPLKIVNDEMILSFP